MAQIMNDPTAAQVALGHAIAASSANSAYLVMARLASETLPIIHNAIELVIIGVFPIILVLRRPDMDYLLHLAADPGAWIALVTATPMTPDRYGSSEKYSKLRPAMGVRCRQTPGPSSTC